jgi:hypothetical protein
MVEFTPDELAYLRTKKYMVIGHSQHGKDTVCELMKLRYGLAFRSSSIAAAELAVFPTLSRVYSYKTVAECYADRNDGHQQEWFDLIAEYNKPPTRLADEIYANSQVYCGMRRQVEFDAVVAKHKPVVIWVDASLRKPPQESGMELNTWCADYIIDNNGSLQRTSDEISWLMKTLIENKDSK